MAPVDKPGDSPEVSYEALKQDGLSAAEPVLCPPGIKVLLTEAELLTQIDNLADRLAPALDKDWCVISILIGATLFTSDLLKALARRGLYPSLDALWLESYKDAQESSGRVLVRADIARSVRGRGVLILDDVFDTGRTLAFARRHLLAKGAGRVLTCTLARKPWAPHGQEDVDYYAFAAPGQFLVGYGMDMGGKYRGLPYIGVVEAGEQTD